MGVGVSLSIQKGPTGPFLLTETIGRYLSGVVREHGGREALVVRHQKYRATYAELWEATSEAARGLLALGILKGDRVGIWQMKDRRLPQKTEKPIAPRNMRIRRHQREPHSTIAKK